MKVFCDNSECMYIDEDGFCDCAKLEISGGVCMGSIHGSRNVTDNDADEKLRKENEELRELCSDMLSCILAYKRIGSNCWECPHHRDVDGIRSACFIRQDAMNLGIKVKS